MTLPKLIAGNWKMNGLVQDSMELIDDLLHLIQHEYNGHAHFLISPPATLLSITSSRISNSPIKLGGQDCHYDQSGAYTGNISAPMLQNIGCSYVILGHSERRVQHNETSELVAKKAKAAHQSNLISIICVGETEEDRENGKEYEIIEQQLKQSIPDSNSTNSNTVIAYEPVWAIGTGKTASIEDIESMHQFIRDKLNGLVSKHDQVQILYGGSVKPSNAEEILNAHNVNGALVGGASLDAKSFFDIANAI